MANIFTSCIAGLFLAMAINSNIYAQADANAITPEHRNSSKNHTPQPDNVSESGAIIIKDARPNEVNSRAMRNFVKNYENATDITWLNFKNGFSAAYFLLDSVQNTVLFNKQGICEWRMRTYREDKLPRHVRHVVKSTYYDYNIYCINEVTVNDKIAYIIKLGDNISLKIVKVLNEELEIMEEYGK